jgi:hypothetical protein
MATILRHFADDILSTLKQTMDDKKISMAQVVYWTSVVGNQLKAKHIQNRSSGAFLSTFTELPVLPSIPSSNSNVIQNRKAIFLPSTIYDFDGDRGIEYISYESTGAPGMPPKYTRVSFTRTTQKKSRILYFSKYETPSPSNPFYIRMRDYVVLLGIEQTDVPTLEVGLYVAFDPLTQIDIDQPMDFPDELLHVLKRQVLDLGRFSLQMPEERKNDGDASANTTQVPVQKITSVQEQNQANADL